MNFEDVLARAEERRLMHQEAVARLQRIARPSAWEEAFIESIIHQPFTMTWAQIETAASIVDAHASRRPKRRRKA